MIYKKPTYEKNFIQKLEKYIQNDRLEESQNESFSSIEKFRETSERLKIQELKEEKETRKNIKKFLYEEKSPKNKFSQDITQ